MDGDSTFFRHLDINVPRYLKSGWGAHAIQGCKKNEKNERKSILLSGPQTPPGLKLNHPPTQSQISLVHSRS